MTNKFYDREKIVHKCPDAHRNNLMERGARAAHAVQSGVAMEMEITGRQSATQPKHLRTGVNIAMAEHSGLAYLLLTKGVITEEEYLTAITEAVEEEQRTYELRLSKHFGRPVTLA